MRGAPDRLRALTWVAVALAWLLTGSAPALALNPALDVSQYAHTSWKVRDGFFKSGITAIAQTPDGYLWLGTDLGLLLFDGVRSVPWQPPRGQSLPHSFIRSLYVGGDGTLWIGTLGGLASWKDGLLRQYPEVSGIVNAVLEDRKGVVWVGTNVAVAGSSGGRLCAIRLASVHCYGTDRNLGRWVDSLFEDSAGALWATSDNRLSKWTSDSPKLFAMPDLADSLQGLTEGDNGTLLVATRDGIARCVNGEIVSLPIPPSTVGIQKPRLLRDRDGGLWIGTVGAILHLHSGRIDAFTRSDGLSGEVNRFFEDREGTVWVGTMDGLDRFRELAVTTFSIAQGLHRVSDIVVSDGDTWLNTNNVLNRLDKGHITVYGRPTVVGAQMQAPTPWQSTTGEIAGLRGQVSSIFRDHRGRIWVAMGGGVGYLDNDRFILIRGVGGGEVNSIVEDGQKNLWVLNQTLGLVRIQNDKEVQQIPWSSLGHDDHAHHGAADLLRGGVWLGFFQGGVVYYADGQVRASYAAKDGLGKGRVNHLRIDKSGTLWISTEGGLSRLKDGHLTTLTTTNGLPCDDVLWTVEDDADSVWLRTACGLVRVARAELDPSADAVDKSSGTERTIQAAVFDASDGVRSGSIVSAYSPQVDKSTDGRLWFADFEGLSVIDPRHLPFNPHPPPVRIEQITADRKTYSATSLPHARLPALTRDIQIDYTALSLVAPEKNRFRVRLDGWDSDWIDMGNGRQKFYSNLPPRSYRFRVTASNNSGVWNETGADLDFSVDPAYYQTWWFLAAIIGTALLLLAGLYRLRVRQVAHQYNLRIEERVNERIRIARDLHDTLLQSFHAVVLRFRAATYLLPDGADDARKAFDGVIDDASKAIVDARNAVQGLRASTDPATTVVDAIAALAKELEAEDASPSRPQFVLHVEGIPGILQPLVRDDVYRIAREALRNAFRHANATQIEVDVRYDRRQFRLRIRDDGKGIDDTVAAAGARPGHYGLAGMRERAELIGGTFTLWSERGSGTEIELTIPSSIAYAKPSATRADAGT